MRRIYEVRVKVSKEELRKIKSKSEELGLTVSGFTRFLLLNSVISPLNVHG